MNTILWPLLSLTLVAGDWDSHPENVWVKQSPTAERAAPMFGWEGSGAYDPWGKKWIHFGGHDGIPQGFHLFTYDLEKGAWEQRFAPTSPAGVCCVDGSHTFDVAQRRFVVFPGGSLGHGYQWSRGVKLRSSAVWLYDPAANAWTNMRPAPYQRPLTKEENIGGLNAGATYDPRHELSISFGGQGSSGGTSNLHFYDAHDNQLHRITAPNAPSARDGMGLVCDPKNDCLVVFGSQYANDTRTHIYRFRSGKWEAHDLDPHPPAKKGKTYATIPRMAYDTHNEVCLCLVWDDATGKHETWVLDVAALKWTKMSPPTEPEPSMSRSRNLDFSAEHNVFILDSNPAALKGKGVQIWTYRYKKAAPPKNLPAPARVEVVTDVGKANLAWTPVKGAASYHVLRADQGDPWTLDFTKVATTREPMFEEILAGGKGYVYTVRAVSDSGVVGADSVRVRTRPRVLLKPVVSVLGKDRVEVAWNKHPASDVAGYNVYRGQAAVRTVQKGVLAPWRDNDPEYTEPMPVEVRNVTGIKKLNDKLLTETTYADRVDLAAPGAESDGYRFAVHAYVVRAVNKQGVESGPSPYALTIPSEPVNVLNREKGNVAELKWDANPEKGIVGYHLYKLEGTWKIVRVTEKPIQATTFQQQSAATRFWITAVDALGQEGQPSSPVWHLHSYKGFFQGEWHQ